MVSGGSVGGPQVPGGCLEGPWRLATREEAVSRDDIVATENYYFLEASKTTSLVALTC